VRHNKIGGSFGIVEDFWEPRSRAIIKLFLAVEYDRILGVPTGWRHCAIILSLVSSCLLESNPDKYGWLKDIGKLRSYCETYPLLINLSTLPLDKNNFGIYFTSRFPGIYVARYLLIARGLMPSTYLYVSYTKKYNADKFALWSLKLKVKLSL
jgi:hypothetical protein